ncbi:MAG: AAA family ATPase [Alphaproteobacteria bacterium]|nr:AAA family ATPase [Alphaproteobacteria bacterium]
MNCKLSPSDLSLASKLTSKHILTAPKKIEIIGQERALEALNFGIRMNAAGYNIFCAGPKGVGRTTLSLSAVKKYASTCAAPDDWCYIHNFETPHQPIAVSFPAGSGKTFAKTMKKMIEALRSGMTLAFSDASYKTQLAAIESKFKNEKDAYFDKLQSLITEKNVTLVKTAAGVLVAPTVDGKILEPETFNKLPKATRKSILEQMTAAQKRIESVIKETPKWEETQAKLLAELQIRTAQKVLKAVMGPLEKTYADHPVLHTHIQNISDDILENLTLFSLGGTDAKEAQNELLEKYNANLFVSNKASSGAPVVHLSHPTLTNLIGKIERVQQSGTVLTDFSMIRSGALQQANGGFLIIEARELIANPCVWNALKRSLFSHYVKIESGSDDNSVFDVVSLDPAAIPLNIKVILIGETGLYYALAGADDDFGQLFKILAQFNEKMPRTIVAEKQYAALLNSLVKKEGLKSLNLAAMKKMIEHAARIAGLKTQLTTYLAHINDIVREANYYAVIANAKSIDVPHIEQALASRKVRIGSMHIEMVDMIKRGVINIDTGGYKIGQLNGLVVHETSDYAFGRPTRITCQIRMGNGEMIDIEREVELGGPLHSKGVLILSSFLAGRFYQNTPMSLDASIVFEQSYSELDGDSASSAELYCLLSAISGVALNQSIAVTGSVNQLGQVQAIGGVNEKVEGFFEICKLHGLTGEQGVIIPASNVQNLMLSREVVEAVKAKKFHLWAVKTIDEGIEILTGKPAGVANKNGVYPNGTINKAVADNLFQYFQRMQKINQMKK